MSFHELFLNLRFLDPSDEIKSYDSSPKLERSTTPTIALLGTKKAVVSYKAEAAIQIRKIYEFGLLLTEANSVQKRTKLILNYNI
ncbi:MAG: hypothetical protein KME64_34045 [Scytonematopsis contorta HA4267-MV1]|nr:hypothetical protein [Scytonematopsis contorta HA4267-MV1]